MFCDYWLPSLFSRIFLVVCSNTSKQRSQETLYFFPWSKVKSQSVTSVTGLLFHSGSGYWGLGRGPIVEGPDRMLWLGWGRLTWRGTSWAWVGSLGGRGPWGIHIPTLADYAFVGAKVVLATVRTPLNGIVATGSSTNLWHISIGGWIGGVATTWCGCGLRSLTCVWTGGAVASLWVQGRGLRWMHVVHLLLLWLLYHSILHLTLKMKKDRNSIKRAFWVTMLQKFSKCEVKAWLCRNWIILPPLRFYVKSSFGRFKQSKHVIFWQF